MQKTIGLLTTEGKKKDIPMLANAATSIRYRQVFHEDMTIEVRKATETGYVSVDFPAKLAYIMANAAVGADMKTLSEDGFIEWLELFEGDTFITESAQIMQIYYVNQNATSTGKN